MDAKSQMQNNYYARMEKGETCQIHKDPSTLERDEDKKWILENKLKKELKEDIKTENTPHTNIQDCKIPSDDFQEELKAVDTTNTHNLNIKRIYQCSKCNFSTRKRKKLRVHLKSHEDQHFQCNVCKKEFGKLCTLKRHQLTHANRKHYLCDLCGRSYLHSISLKYHKLGHLKHNPIAGERTKIIQEKNKRIANKVEEKSKKYLCDLCGKVFKQAVSLKSHYLKHQQNTTTSNENKNNFASDFDYEIYLNKKRPGPKRKHPLVTEKKRFKCSECPYSAARSRDVVVHLRTHTGEKPFPCNICGKYFSKESVVERHKSIHGTLKSRKEREDLSNVKNCNATQKTSSYYVKPNVTHTTFPIKNESNIKDEPTFKYPYFDNNCDPTTNSLNRILAIRASYDTNNGKIHQQRQENETNTHSGELYNGSNLIKLNPKYKVRHKKSIATFSEYSHNRYLNSQNNKYLQTANTFHNYSAGHLATNNHLTSKETNLVQNCDANVNHHQNYLNSASSSKENVNNATEKTPHVIRIDGKEMFSLKKDKKTTKSAKEKKDSSKRIKGVKKKHKCEECPYETFLSRDMRVHMRKHSGERPFPCPICGKRFTKESVVKRHQSVHTGLRPYACEYCFKTFSQQSNLKTHKIAHFDITTGQLKNNVRVYKKEKVVNCVEITDISNQVAEEISVDVKCDEISVGEIKLENNSTNITNDGTSMLKMKNTDIEMINVNEFKTEVFSSDDECLSKIKESIMNSNNNKVKTDVSELSVVKEELNDGLQNDDHCVDYDDEFNGNIENIQNDSNIMKSNDKELNEVAERLERKKRKKLKKKMKKLKEKTAKMKHNYELYKDDFNSQRISDGDKILFKCNECHYSVVNKRDLIVHMRSHSGEKLFSCDICMKKFSKQSVVNRHKLIHFGIRPFTCHLCGMTFTQSNSLKKHVEIKHGVQEKDLPFKCDVCPATFAQEKSLKTHKHAHLRKKNNEFTCHVCGKVFPHECRLKSHLLLHDERQFNCTICSKKFLRKYDLKYHLMVHTQEKLSMCHICGGSFSTPATLKMHLRSHSTIIDHRCNICNESFSKSTELIYHKVTIHKDIKSFQCLMCDKFFAQASGLKKHQITHSTSRPHQCLVCSKRFKVLGHLHKHYNTTKHGSINGDDLIKNNDANVN